MKRTTARWILGFTTFGFLWLVQMGIADALIDTDAAPDDGLLAIIIILVLTSGGMAAALVHGAGCGDEWR